MKAKYTSLKSSEEIFNRAKVILKSFTDQHSDLSKSKTLNKVNNKEQEYFLKALFSFHPTKGLNEDYNYTIFTGSSHNYSCFFILPNYKSQTVTPTDDDSISLKKCIQGLNLNYTEDLHNFINQKFHSTPLKSIGSFLTKLMRTYPLSQQYIMKCLIEKMPHKNMPVESQLIYNRILYQVAKEFPKKEMQLLSLIVERLC